jgi:RNA polymerase sigma-70 factor (ECF subfamily)
MADSVDGQDEKTGEFVALLTRHSGAIYTFIRTLVPSRTDAEDLAQEVSATLWQKFGDYREGTNFRAWAFQVARYKVRSFRRSRAHLPQLFSDELLEQLAWDYLSIDGKLEADFHALADCYQKLSAEDRNLLDLRYVEAAPVCAVAARTGRSVGFVYKALRRIYGSLYRCIDEAIRGDNK